MGAGGLLWLAPSMEPMLRAACAAIPQEMAESKAGQPLQGGLDFQAGAAILIGQANCRAAPAIAEASRVGA